jgi:hypothetical protein
MRFHEPVLGVIERNNDGDRSHLVIGSTASSNRVATCDQNNFYRDNNVTSEKCLQTLKSIIQEKDSESFTNTKSNDFNSRDVNRVTSLETFLKLKADSCGYFKNFLDTDTNRDLNGNGDNEDANLIVIETLNLTEDNLSRVSTIFMTTD